MTRPSSTHPNVHRTSVVLTPRQSAWLDRQVKQRLADGELPGVASRSLIIRDLIAAAMASDGAATEATPDEVTAA